MVLESDCQSVVSNIQAIERDHSQLWQIIEETQEIGGQLNRLHVTKISRDQNNLAHEFSNRLVTRSSGDSSHHQRFIL